VWRLEVTDHERCYTPTLAKQHKISNKCVPPGNIASTRILVVKYNAKNIGLAKAPRTTASKRGRSVPQFTLRCIDLFAGAGGFSLAALRAGVKVTAAVEINNHACDTYQANIIKQSKNTKLYNSDILKLDPQDVRKLHFPPEKPCDIVLGGPPCQGFSTHRINDAGVNDPRNALVLRYFEFVAELMPKVFLMENVPGILWPRHKSFLENFYQEGQKAGYHVFAPVTIDARNYGVPQRRKRVFILGHRLGADFSIEWPPSPTHCDPDILEPGEKLKPWVPAKAVFDAEPLVDDPNDVHMRHSTHLIAAFEATPPNGGSRKDSGRILDCHANHDGHGDVYGRIDPSKPAPTMTTACINPSKGRFVHPTEHHGITVRQAARFQTFPDDFVFHGGLMASGEQIGNAVPVKLGEIILKHIKSALRKGDSLSERE
jgi:DNA (cytosine-5)-methyltransferase 1